MAIPETTNGEVVDTPYFDRDDISSLDDDYPSIIFMAACSCGDYSVNNAVAKELLHHGAVSTVASAGNVQYTVPWYDEGYGRIQTFQYLWNKRHVDAHYQIGGALMSAKTLFASSYNWDEGTQQILLNMNFYGDPGLARDGIGLRPNLDYYWPSGWSYVVVPRATNDATATWCPASSTLPGNTNGTYLNYSIENNGNVTTYQVYSRIYIDDIYVYWSSWQWLDPGEHREHNNFGPITVKGGRHTIKVTYDPLDECTESNEYDNSYLTQYIWSPFEMSDETPHWRGTPPVPGAMTYKNCDGFQCELGSGQYWVAVGILPYNANDNYDIRMYEDYENYANGFDTYHVASELGAGQTDFVIANRNEIGSAGPFYPGVIRTSGGNAGFWIQQSNSDDLLAKNTTTGPYTIHTYDVVDMHEVYLTAGAWYIALDNTSGSADLGLTVYDRSMTFCAKHDYMSGGYSNWEGAGGDERCIVNVASSGYYGIAVWKTGSSDNGLSNTYTLHVGNDFTSPTPNPMTWNIAPYPLSTSHVGMIATTASDPSGVEYSFDCQYATGGGGTDSDWQSSTYYYDYDLDPNETYGYVVTARDMSPIQLPGNPSGLAYVSTYIETPTSISVTATTTSSISVKSSSTPSNLSEGSSGLLIENVTNGTNSGWKQDNNSWTSSGLAPNTFYSFRAKARNRVGVATAYCTIGSTYTRANVPGADSFSNVTTNSIQANWTSGGNPAGTQYFCENMTTGQNSGWTIDTSWTSGGLSPDTPYEFRVKAWNHFGIETAWRSLGTQATDPITYTLSLSKTGSGSVRVDGVLKTLPWSGPFEENTVVALEAVPDTCWSFNSWSGNLSGSTNPTSITMGADKNITANFTQVYYTLSSLKKR